MRKILPIQVRAYVAATLFIVLVAAVPAAGADLPGPRQHWIELQSPNFLIFSHAGAGASREVASDLEELRAVLSEFSSLELSSPVPTYIYIFRSDRDFKPYKPLRQGRPTTLSGYFDPRRLGNYIAIDGNARRDATGIVYHEYVHYFVANNAPGLPLWFEEGLAELYSSLRITGRAVEFGFPDPYHILRLRTSQLIPLHELITADQYSDLYNERDRKSMFYAESWALVHYLLVGSDERRNQTPQFLGLVADGVPPTDALTRAFHTDEHGLETELRQYTQRDIFAHLERPASVEVDPQITVRPMSHADVLCRLGDLLAGQDEPRPEAREYFEAAVEADPMHGLSWSALAVLAERQARWNDARSLHDRAVAASPDNFLVQYHLGVFLLERSSDIGGAIVALRRVTELAPGFGPAWVELTAAYRASGERDAEAIAVAETAHRLSPARTDIAHDLLRLYLTDDRRDAAVGLVEDSFVGGPPDRARAWSAVADNDLERARLCLADGRLDDADQRLELAQGIVPSTSAPAAFRQRLEALRSDLDLLRFGRAYDEAVRLFEQGDRDGARAILTELLDDLPDERRDSKIESMLRVIDGQQAAEPGTSQARPLAGINSEDINEFNRRMARHDLAGARDLLYDLQSRAHPEEYGWIDARLAEIRVIESYNRFVERYNRAVDQFNAGDFAAAVATLERLLAEQPDEYGADDARELLRDARAELEHE